MATAHLPGDGRRLGGDAEELLVRPGCKFNISYSDMYKASDNKIHLARAAMVQLQLGNGGSQEVWFAPSVS